jgi:Tol biopolymer transport system component
MTTSRIALALTGLLTSSCFVDAPHYVAPDGGGDDAEVDAPPDGNPGPCVLRIVFADGTTPNNDVFIVNANGTGLVNLSEDAASGGWPSVGPSGRVYFQSRLDDAEEVYGVNEDGTDLENLTENAARDYWPEVSPDGTMIAFQRDGGLVVMTSDGSGAHVVASGIAYQVAWNAQSTRLAFELHPTATNSEIWVVGADGNDLNQLTSNAAYDGSPSWSPSGDRIAFFSNRTGTGDIFIMSAVDGSGVVNITNDAPDDVYPMYSPDGTTIAYSSDADIVLVPAAGGLQSPLTSGSADDYFPRWSPDGERVLFRREDASGRKVGVVPATGGDVDTIVGPSGDYSDNARWAACP